MLHAFVATTWPGQDADMPRLYILCFCADALHKVVTSDAASSASAVRATLLHLDSMGTHDTGSVHHCICTWLAKAMEVSVAKVEQCLPVRVV